MSPKGVCYLPDTDSRSVLAHKGQRHRAPIGGQVRPGTPEDERWACEHFDPSLSFEEWAAHNAHEFAMFSFHEIHFADRELHDWVQGLAEWLFAPRLGERLRSAREKYLTPDRIAEYEAHENDPF